MFQSDPFPFPNNDLSFLFLNKSKWISTNLLPVWFVQILKFWAQLDRHGKLCSIENFLSPPPFFGLINQHIHAYQSSTTKIHKKIKDPKFILYMSLCFTQEWIENNLKESLTSFTYTLYNVCRFGTPCTVFQHQYPGTFILYASRKIILVKVYRLNPEVFKNIK